MASIDLNESKLEKFQNEIKDEKSFGKKINTLFQEQYKDNIDDILILKDEMFLAQVREGVQLLLEENYTDNCLSDDRLIDLITDNMDEIHKQYNHDISLINKAWMAYEKVSKRRTNNEYYLSNFRKHCMYTQDRALHNCCSGGRAKNCHFIYVYNADIKKEIKFVICEKCKKVFYSSFIQAYCNKCNKEYYTSILGPEENPDMLLATWENYHCPQLINEKMKCIKCHEYFYINMKNGILTCLNQKCQFTTKPSKILWTCTLCNSDFKSEAIPYNPLDVLRTQKLVEQTILLKHKAHPKKMPCCKLNVFFTDFFHKIECDGLLYEMELNDKIIVACEKCKAINYYERFKWTCPKCGKRFRDKSSIANNINNNNTQKTEEDNNDTKDIINDFNKKNATLNKENKCYSLGKNKFRNSIYSSIHRNIPKELILNNSTIKDEKDILQKKGSTIVPSSSDIPRKRKRYRTRVEQELNLGEIKKIINANEELDDNRSKEDSNKRLRRVGFQAVESEQNQEFNNSCRRPSRFGINKKENKEINVDNEVQKEEKEEKEDEDTLKTIIENFPDKKDSEEPGNNKMRKSNTNKNTFSRFKVDRKTENKDKKNEKEEKEEDKKEKNIEKNLSPRLMWKRKKQLENSKKQNILDLYAVNNNKKEEKVSEKDKNKEKDIKDSKQNLGGPSWFKRRQEKKEREEKENNQKEDKKVINRSPVRQYRNKHAKVFAYEKEKEKNVDSENNEKAEEENNETEDTKETEAKIIFKDKEKEEKEEKKEDIKEEKEEKKEKKLAMSKIPGVSEKLYNHINKRIQVILDRCKIPVFNVEDYMFDRKLGEGGYAIIFAVYKMDDETCKEYAMKKIIARTLNEIDNFTKEFELVYSIDHPNIMKIYGICIRMLDQTTFSLYVLMEISSGDWDSDIKKHLLKKKSYTEKELISILRQLTDALLFIQQNLKISHRDIKPQNVLLFDDGVYKIADFGEAKESKINKDINTLRGTELYMSPALYAGLKNESSDVKHDPYKSDVFSLGFCFIYAAALNFKLLYQLRDVYNSNQMNQILKQQLNKKYSDTFIDILSHMMEVDESLRYDFSHLMEAINTNYDDEGNLKNPDIEKKFDSKRGFRKYK